MLVMKKYLLPILIEKFPQKREMSSRVAGRRRFACIALRVLPGSLSNSRDAERLYKTATAGEYH